MVRNLANKKYFPHRRGLALVSNRGLVFPIIHKNGTTSLQNLFQTERNQRTIQYYSTEEFNKLGGTKVAILRDPLSRFVSGIRQISGKPYDRRTLKHILDRVESYSPEFTNVHLIPQSWFLEGKKIDRYLRLENMEEDWAKLAEEFNLDPFPHKHATSGKVIRCITEIVEENKDLKERILKYLEKDYDLINRVFK
jgi:hypothetical protein